MTFPMQLFYIFFSLLGKISPIPTSISTYRILSGFAGSTYGRPTLEPDNSIYGCPEDASVKLTYRAHEVQAMAWKADRYIPVNNPVI